MAGYYTPARSAAALAQRADTPGWLRCCCIASSLCALPVSVAITSIKH